MLEDDQDVLSAMAVLEKTHPEKAVLLKHRLLDYHAQFLPLLEEFYRIINDRHWHNLEGWHAILGNVVNQYRLDPQGERWLTDGEFQKCLPAMQEAVMKAAVTDRRYIREYKLSPSEVADRDSGGLIKLQPWIVSDMLGDEAFRPEPLKVAGADFNTFKDAELGPEEFRFESIVQDVEGNEAQLPDDKYLVKVNPFDLSKLFVHTATGKFLGTAGRAWRTDQGDVEALRRAHGHARHRVAELNRPLLQRHAGDGAQGWSAWAARPNEGQVAKTGGTSMSLQGCLNGFATALQGRFFFRNLCPIGGLDGSSFGTSIRGRFALVNLRKSLIFALFRPFSG
jgi:hypothetical protein